MIARIWHGWTSHENADTYERLLKEEIFVEIESRNIRGFKKISLLKRDLKEETEFITIMIFADMTSVKSFAGDDYEHAIVPDKAREVLLRYDRKSQHYTIEHEIISY